MLTSEEENFFLFIVAQKNNANVVEGGNGRRDWLSWGNKYHWYNPVALLSGVEGQENNFKGAKAL